MKILNNDEAKAFLTKQDLQKLKNPIEIEGLMADLLNGVPIVVVRKQAIPLFVILELVNDL